ASGGTQVTIRGQGFTTDPQPRVSFGSVLAQFVSSTSTTVVVNAPQSPSPVSTGSTLVVDVTVDVPATDVTAAQTDTLPGSFTYTAGGGAAPRIPTIQRIQASSTGTNAGDNAGGYAVTIFGSNFEDPLVVKIGSGSSVSSFDGVTVTATRVNGGQINIPSMPPASPSQLNSSVDILVQNQTSGLGAVAQSGFSYQSPDVVVDAEPGSVTYYNASSTQVTVKVRGLDVAGGASTLDTSRYTLEFGGETQCGSGTAACSLSGPDAGGTFTLVVPQSGGIVPVTPSNCTDQSGAVTLTDRVTTETAGGSTFSYSVEKPSISGLSGSNSTCSAPPCDAASGGSTLTLTGQFSPTELSSAQVLINGQSAPFQSSGCQDAPNLATCTLTATVPGFTGTFDSASCTSGGETGTRDQPKQVDVEVLY
ncbi:MAG: IPT/TIG domain-containing protein, partial [Acidobacteriota bacterium]